MAIGQISWQMCCMCLPNCGEMHCSFHLPGTETEYEDRGKFYSLQYSITEADPWEWSLCAKAGLHLFLSAANLPKYKLGNTIYYLLFRKYYSEIGSLNYFCFQLEEDFQSEKF